MRLVTIESAYRDHISTLSAKRFGELLVRPRSHDGANHGDQIGGLALSAQLAIGAAFEPIDAIALGGDPEDDGGREIMLDPPAQIDVASIRHVQVENDEMRLNGQI